MLKMRLLQIDKNGKFSLTNDLLKNIPPYAILSHTWGDDCEEVTFNDLTTITGKEPKSGYGKLHFCAQRATADNLQHFWIDTCCIDKSNSTELQEAINSMFKWYQNATKCYVYLSDVSETDWELDFCKSRWFTRGWTLQELISPNKLEFYSKDGTFLGDKKTLVQQIHEITGISIAALQGSSLSHFGTNERFKWAENRQTTRPEDEAYSLLGIFGIYMPLIYGEGKEHAFLRLRNEVENPLRSENF
jgi:hypothetical protein